MSRGQSTSSFQCAHAIRRSVGDGSRSSADLIGTKSGADHTVIDRSHHRSSPCCMGRGCGRTQPGPSSGLCDADVLQRPSSSIRFSTSAVMATSVACRPSVCEWSPSPIIRFHLEMSASTRARQLYPDTLCQPMRPCSARHRRWASRLRGRSPGCLARHRARARRHDHGRGGMAGHDVGVGVVAVVSAVASEGRHCPIDPIEQGADLGAVVGILVGQHRGDDASRPRTSGRVGWPRSAENACCRWCTHESEAAREPGCHAGASPARSACG